MVLEALGVSKSEAQIRQDSKCSPQQGTDANDLVEAAKKYGFVNSVKDFLSFSQLRKELRQGHYPIVYIGVELSLNAPSQEHAVVVIEIDRKGVHILDPERGEKIIPKQAFEKQRGSMRQRTILVK